VNKPAFAPNAGPRDAPDLAHQLVGVVGQVVTPCRPRGEIRVRGELWPATCAQGAEPGAAVRVTSVEGRMLTVAPRG
jgi:membrane protein implicated in regulation of membrane protease activity